MKKTIQKIGIASFFAFFITTQSFAEENYKNMVSEIDFISYSYKTISETQTKINYDNLPKVDAIIAEEKQDNLFVKYSKMTSSVLQQGMSYIGIPYRWGGNTEKSGFDCSGLVRAVFQNSIGVYLPRTAKEMSSIGDYVSSHELKPGDLVFFNTMRRAFSHVGVYIGDNKFLHAPRRGQKVRVEDMNENYWTQRFNGARRIVEVKNNEQFSLVDKTPKMQ